MNPNTRPSPTLLHARHLARAGSAAALAGAAFLGGCAPYQAPSLAVQDVTLADATPEGFVLNFELAAANPNEVFLPLRDVEYEVVLTTADGRTWRFEGMRLAEATLRSEGTQEIVLPAAFPREPDAPAPAGVTQYTLDGRLRYVTPGAFAEMLFDVGVRRPTVHFQESGEIDFGPPSSFPSSAPAVPPVPPPTPSAASEG